MTILHEAPAQGNPVAGDWLANPLSTGTGLYGYPDGVTTLPDWVASVRNESAAVLAVRAMKADPDGYKRRKDRLPWVMLPGDYSAAGRRRQTDAYQPSGMVFCELDAVGDGDTPAQARDSIAEHPAVIAAWLSCGGTGVHLAIAVSPPPQGNLAYHAAWEAAVAALELPDGVNDAAVKNCNRISYLGADPDAYCAGPDDAVSPVAWAITEPEPEPEPQRLRRRGQNGASADTPAQARDVLRWLDPPPEYDDWLRLVMSAKMAGLTAGEVDAWSRRGASYQPGEVESRWDGIGDTGVTAATLFGWARDKGWRPGVNGNVNGATDAAPDGAAWAPPPGYSDRYGTWDASVVADTARTLRANAGRLLIAQQNSKPSRLLYDAGCGVWTNQPDGIQRLIGETRIEWAADAVRHAPGEAAQRAAGRWRRTQDTPEAAARIANFVGRVYDYWRQSETDAAIEPPPPALTHCHEDMIDASTRYLGCGNGVIDLDTGELLTGDAARERLVTAERSAAVDYRPGATHPAVDLLFAHLRQDDREWLLKAVGFALRGNPSRRLYLLVGPGGGGKSTALDAIANALGNAGGHLPTAALQTNDRGSASQPEAISLQDWRVAVITESETRARNLSVSRIKAAAGGDRIALRRLYQNEMERRRTSATMFWACNDESQPSLPVTDSGMAERLRILRYPAIPEGDKDVDFAAKLATPEAREALFALLVRYAVANPKPPDDCPTVADARREYRREQIGPVGDWLQNALVKDPQGRVGTGELYDAAFAAAGMDDAVDPDGKPWGKDKASITKLARDLHGMPAVKVMRHNGKTCIAAGWAGGWQLRRNWRLAAAACG